MMELDRFPEDKGLMNSDKMQGMFHPVARGWRIRREEPFKYYDVIGWFDTGGPIKTVVWDDGPRIMEAEEASNYWLGPVSTED